MEPRNLETLDLRINRNPKTLKLRNIIREVFETKHKTGAQETEEMKNSSSGNRRNEEQVPRKHQK